MMELMGSKTVLKRYGFVKASRDCTGYLATTKNSSSGQLASWLVVGVEQFAGAGGRFRLSLHNGVSLFKFLVLKRNQSSQNILLELLLGKHIASGDHLHITELAEEFIDNESFRFVLAGMVISNIGRLSNAVNKFTLLLVTIPSSSSSTTPSLA